MPFRNPRDSEFIHAYEWWIRNASDGCNTERLSGDLDTTTSYQELFLFTLDALTNVPNTQFIGPKFAYTLSVWLDTRAVIGGNNSTSEVSAWLGAFPDATTPLTPVGRSRTTNIQDRVVTQQDWFLNLDRRISHVFSIRARHFFTSVDSPYRLSGTNTRAAILPIFLGNEGFITYDYAD